MIDHRQLHVFGQRPASERLAVRAMGVIDNCLEKAEDAALPVALGAAVLLCIGGVGGMLYALSDVIDQPVQTTFAQVVDTRHTDAYMLTTYSPIDDKGNMVATNIYMPDSFEARIKIPEREGTTSVSISEETYSRLKESGLNGAQYHASFREGRWSHKVRMVDLDEPLQPVTDGQISGRRPGRSR